MRVALAVLTFGLAIGACGQTRPSTAIPPPQAVDASGCLSHEFESNGPQTEAAKLLAQTKGEALYDALSQSAKPAVATGWSLKQVRERHPAARLRIRDGVFSGRLVEVHQAGVGLFALNLTADGETFLNPETLAETAPENRVMAIETSNARFRTSSGIRPGMAVAQAQQKMGLAILFQQHGISGADSYGEYLQFGKAAPEDLFFSRYRFVAARPKSNTISWNLNVGPNAPKPCEIHWNRDFRPNAVIKTILIDANWAELRPQ